MRILKIIHGYPPDYNAGSEVYTQSICEELARQGHEITVFTREGNPYFVDYALRREQLRQRLQKYVINKKVDKDSYQHARIDEILAAVIAENGGFDVAHIGHLNHLSTGLVDVLAKHNIRIIFTLHDFWLMCPRGQFLRRDTGQPTLATLCEKQENATCAKVCYGCYFSGNADAAEADLIYWTSWVADRMAVARALCEKVSLFIAPSRYLQNRFIDEFGLPKEKVKYLDYGFPLHYLQPKKEKENTKKLEKTTFTFGYIGTHIPAKGVNLLITAFLNLDKILDDKLAARLIIWGRDSGQSSKYLRQLAAQSEGRIEFRGEYANKDLAATVFAEIDAIVVPSIWGENSPLVIHEAQACHLPVITADFGGMSEYVQHGQNGLLFAHRDSDALGEQLAYAIQNPEIMRALGRRGYLYDEAGKVPEIGAHCQQLLAFFAPPI
jgi:glycosyltransferase involved in cell wall biosynthesis